MVFILTDDRGSIDVNCYGAKDLITPNLDALAESGTRFTQFYVGQPVCSPSRAALLTGRYPKRAQLDGNAYGSRGMPASQVTLAEIMKTAGYRTALFGKWHLGEILDLSPNAQGFDEFLGHRFTVWEGGIRIPCIISWPGHIPEGAVRDQMLSSIDWLPTIADYCKISLPDRTLDGVSISSVIASENAPSPHNTIHWTHGKRWAVRDDNWKLVFDNDEFSLSDMEKDVTETINIAKQYPDIVERLKLKHEDWLKEVVKQ